MGAFFIAFLSCPPIWGEPYPDPLRYCGFIIHYGRRNMDQPAQMSKIRKGTSTRRLAQIVRNSQAAKAGHRIPVTGGYTQFILALIR
jgi:hypothetical protein